MQKIFTETDLRAAILELEGRQAVEQKLLRAQFLVAVDSIKPVNLIKSAFFEVAGSEDIQDNILNSTVGLSAGYLSKFLFQSVSNSPLKKILGTALMFGIKNLVAKNPEIVKSVGKLFFNSVRKLLIDKDQVPAEEGESIKGTTA
jgi:hypothetical protein